MPSPIVHIEFSSLDRRASTDFYSAVFGWEPFHIDEMNYSTMSTGQEGIGVGINPVTENTPAGTVSVYIHSDDIDATLAKIESAGGKTILPKSEIPNTGWFASFSDPTGNIVALYTPLTPPA